MKFINLTMINNNGTISINAEAIKAIEKDTDINASIVYLSKDLCFFVEESVEAIIKLINI